MLWVNGARIHTPSKYTVSIFDVSSSASRNAAGEMMIDRVGVKRKLEMEWPALTNDQTATLLSAVTDIFFNVTYPDPLTGVDRTIECYVGDRTAPVRAYKKGVPVWVGLKMNWIER